MSRMLTLIVSILVCACIFLTVVLEVKTIRLDKQLAEARSEVNHALDNCLRTLDCWDSLQSRLLFPDDLKFNFTDLLSNSGGRYVKEWAESRQTFNDWQRDPYKIKSGQINGLFTQHARSRPVVTNMLQECCGIPLCAYSSVLACGDFATAKKMVDALPGNDNKRKTLYRAQLLCRKGMVSDALKELRSLGKDFFGWSEVLFAEIWYCMPTVSYDMRLLIAQAAKEYTRIEEDDKGLHFVIACLRVAEIAYVHGDIGLSQKLLDEALWNVWRYRRDEILSRINREHIDLVASHLDDFIDAISSSEVASGEDKKRKWNIQYPNGFKGTAILGVHNLCKRIVYESVIDSLEKVYESSRDPDVVRYVYTPSCWEWVDGGGSSTPGRIRKMYEDVNVLMFGEQSVIFLPMLYYWYDNNDGVLNYKKLSDLRKTISLMKEKIECQEEDSDPLKKSILKLYRDFSRPSVMVDQKGSRCLMKLAPGVDVPFDNGKYRTGDVVTIKLPGGATMELIYCAVGEYMGLRDKLGYSLSGQERRKVIVKRGFWLGKYPVTQYQWKSVMGYNPSNFKGDNKPVENLSYAMIYDFVRKIQLGTHYHVTLPTIDQWEYACRAGSTTRFSWGETFNGTEANYEGNVISPSGCTTEVDRFPPNAWGFFDMHGNVWECCLPSQDISDDICVGKGGAWNRKPAYCSYDFGLSIVREKNIGLRQSVRTF